MSNKPASRNWNDIQFVIAALSMAFSLLFWNMFAGPDRLKAAREQANASSTPEPVQVFVPTPIPTILPPGQTILFGGSAPQVQVVTIRGGGGGGGGSAVTSTGSS